MQSYNNNYVIVEYAEELALMAPSNQGLQILINLVTLFAKSLQFLVESILIFVDRSL